MSNIYFIQDVNWTLTPKRLQVTKVRLIMFGFLPLSPLLFSHVVINTILLLHPIAFLDEPSHLSRL